MYILVSLVIVAPILIGALLIQWLTYSRDRSRGDIYHRTPTELNTSQSQLDAGLSDSESPEQDEHEYD